MTDEPKRRGRPPKAKMDKAVDEESSKALVIGICPNPTWVVGKLGGFRIDIKCPASLSKSLIGKMVDVQLVPSDVGNYYEIKK
jgi:hypothetical protein